MISRVRKEREHYSLERPGWQQKRKCIISQQEVEETLEEGGEEVAMVDEVPVGETKKSLRTVSGAEQLIIGAGSALKRTAFAHGVEEWDISNRRATARSMERQGEENQVFQGAEVEVLVLLEEVGMADMGRARMWRNRDMQRC